MEKTACIVDVSDSHRRQADKRRNHRASFAFDCSSRSIISISLQQLDDILAEVACLLFCGSFIAILVYFGPSMYDVYELTEGRTKYHHFVAVQFVS